MPLSVKAALRRMSARLEGLTCGALLAASIIVHSAFTRNVFNGGKPSVIESFAEELPGVSLEHFLHLTSIVGHIKS